MVNPPATGRHRATGRYNPLSELRAVVGAGGSASVKGGAVLAAAGGLVAALGLPATATTARSGGGPASSTAAGLAAAPVAVTAPVAAAAPVSATDFGTLTFTAVAKPRPKPVVRVEQAASRASSRSSLSGTPTGTRKTKDPVRPATGGVLDVAASLTGIPYQWGGTSPSTGFDCSGFTQYVFRQVGISLPRTAEEQRQATTRVSNPQPGDLIFFGAPAWHVGIYAGNGMMYDSPTTGKSTALRAVWSSDNISYGRP